MLEGGVQVDTIMSEIDIFVSSTGAEVSWYSPNGINGFVVGVITILSSCANQILLQTKVQQRYFDDEVCFLYFIRAVIFPSAGNPSALECSSCSVLKLSVRLPDGLHDHRPLSQALSWPLVYFCPWGHLLLAGFMLSLVRHGTCPEFSGGQRRVCFFLK